VICKSCNDDRPETAFQFNHPGGTRRTTCRRCSKASLRRKRGCLTRADIYAAALERATHRKHRAPRSHLIHDHPDREWARLYRNLLFRVKYERDPESERQRQQIYKHAHPAILARQGSQHWRLAAAQADGSLTVSVVRRLLDMTTHCYYCASPLARNERHIDHVVPRSRGGAHSIENVVVCCRSCNRSKHTRTPEEWLGRLRLA
jgi:5-methylcytosine-specific restriction endonuclease McrA